MDGYGAHIKHIWDVTRENMPNCFYSIKEVGNKQRGPQRAPHKNKGSRSIQ